MTTPHPKNKNILMLEKKGEITDQVQAYAWPGGYPIFYIAEDSGVICPKCVQENLELCIGDPGDLFADQWKIIAHEANWENPDLQCDNCNKFIEPAYGEDSTSEKTEI